jgi:cystathionine beta-lyase/cystathionine gamma-synthase
MPKPWEPSTTTAHAGECFHPKVRLGISRKLSQFSVGIGGQPDLITNLERGFKATAEAG